MLRVVALSGANVSALVLFIMPFSQVYRTASANQSVWFTSANGGVVVDH